MKSHYRDDCKLSYVLIFTDVGGISTVCGTHSKVKVNHKVKRESTFIEKKWSYKNIRFSTWYRLNSYYCIQIKWMQYSHINTFCFEICTLISFSVCLDLGITQTKHGLQCVFTENASGANLFAWHYDTWATKIAHFLREFSHDSHHFEVKDVECCLIYPGNFQSVYCNEVFRDFLEDSSLWSPLFSNVLPMIVTWQV